MRRFVPYLSGLLLGAALPTGVWLALAAHLERTERALPAGGMAVCLVAASGGILGLLLQTFEKGMT